MRNLILTAAATVAMLFGGLTWTDTAEARPRGWYRAPAVRYYRPYYGYRTYYRPYYGYRSYYRPYYSYGSPYYGSYYHGPRVGGRVYFNWW
jgi:hypothetical protein